MPATTYEKLTAALNKKEYSNIYLLQGDESYYIDKIAERLENEILNEAEKSFNLSVLYGDDVDPTVIVDHCRQFPMMSDRRVVIIREAQALRNIEDLLKYVENPTPSTILALCYKHKKLDGRTNFSKAIKKRGTILETKRMYDNQLAPWIAGLMGSKGIKFEKDVPGILAEHLGSDLQKIEAEIEKLENNVSDGQVVDAALVEKYVGISKRYNVFELQKAMSVGDRAKAMRITNHLARNPKDSPLIFIIASMFNYFSRLLLTGLHRKASDEVLQSKLKVNPYFLREYRGAMRFWDGRRVLGAFQLLSEYDLRAKGVNNKSTSPEELLKEMMYRIMYQ